MATVLKELPAGVLLKSGCHDNPEEGLCAMEAVAYVTGEPHTDHPKCTCPVIASFMRAWNDGLPDDATRTAMLKPHLLRLIGTRANADVEMRRSMLAFDWLIRVYTPAWLDLMPDLKIDAARLKSLSAVMMDSRSAEVAAGVQVRVLAARSAAELAARSAAESAAKSAARLAAWSAVRSAAELAARSVVESAAKSAAESAAESAAWSATRSAAWSATWSAAKSAARLAARSAAWSAARSAVESAVESAARSAVQPAVHQLQGEALKLVDAMIAIN